MARITNLIYWARSLIPQDPRDFLYGTDQYTILFFNSKTDLQFYKEWEHFEPYFSHIFYFDI